METTMASRPITYQPDFETPRPHGLAAAIARKLAGFARALRAYGIWHDIRVLESRARRHADATARPWSLSAWFGGVALKIAEEIRIRRDMRELSALSDDMLKDIGLSRADIGRAVRYGRD